MTAGTTISLIRGDITEQHVDAIVNAANSGLLGGGGVDGAIHSRGGPAILEECKRLRATTLREGLPTGEAVATGAGRLPARFVIHAVGPVWSAGSDGAAGLLASAYRRSLEEAVRVNARTVAFPSISTGAYRYPVRDAAHIALGTVREFAAAHPDAFEEIRFVLFSQEILEAYQAAWEALQTPE